MVNDPAVQIGMTMLFLIFLLGMLLDFTWSLVRVVYFGALLAFLCVAYLVLIAALGAVNFLEKGMRE